MLNNLFYFVDKLKYDGYLASFLNIYFTLIFNQTNNAETER